MELNDEIKKYLVKWDESMIIGIKDLDEEHKGIIDRLNDIITKIFTADDSITIDDLIEFLYEYTEKHCKSEEELQKKYDFPRYVEHKNSHKEFINTITEIKYVINSNSSEARYLAVDINEKVFQWLKKHINTYDKELAKYVSENIKDGD